MTYSGIFEISSELLEKSFFPISDPYICGGKYTKWEKNQKWKTTIVFNIQKSLISIEIRCENLAIGEVLPQVKPPFLLKKLKDWGGVDKNLQLSSKAHNLPACDVWKAREIINGNFTLRKPIVYLSATLSNRML